jgi:4,5-dihydroxyphthalate decarboxylase
MEKMFLTVACGDYDRTRALRDGSVEVEGVELNYVALQAEEIFWRMTNYQEFDASELSLSNYLTMVDRGNCPFVAIPVFPSRFFRHSCVFINVDSGIRKPADLAGKKVGAPEYSITAAAWIRGFLKDDYGVAAQDMQWFIGGQEEPGRKERIALKLPPEIRLSTLPPDKTLNAMLENREIDALISARVPSCFVKGSPKVRRLFPDYKEVEIDYYRRTKIFPIMHVLVIRRAVFDRHPWVARSLYKAFCQAKERAVQHMHLSNTLTHTLPWLFAEMDLLKGLFGRDWWPYGIEPNRHTLESLIRYMREQHLVEKPLDVDSLFPPNVAGDFKI